jgi:hypothetical protein
LLSPISSLVSCPRGKRPPSHHVVFAAAPAELLRPHHLRPLPHLLVRLALLHIPRLFEFAETPDHAVSVSVLARDSLFFFWSPLFFSSCAFRPGGTKPTNEPTRQIRDRHHVGLKHGGARKSEELEARKKRGTINGDETDSRRGERKKIERETKEAETPRKRQTVSLTCAAQSLVGMDLDVASRHRDPPPQDLGALPAQR